MQPPEWKEYDEWSPPHIEDANDWLAAVREFARLAHEAGPGEDSIGRTMMTELYDGCNRPNKLEPKPVDQDIPALLRNFNSCVLSLLMS